MCSSDLSPLFLSAINSRRKSGERWSPPEAITLAEIFLFGGTSEGRRIAAKLNEKKIPSIVFVATDYGGDLLEESETLAKQTGRLDREAMKREMLLHRPELVIDATHPYAEQVSREIEAACDESATSYLRIDREGAVEKGELYFENLDQLIVWLNEGEDIIFSTLGAKSVGRLSEVKNYQKRVWVRVLPMQASLELCREAEIPPSHIICMQGPFTKELNTAMFRTSEAGILLTKDSGGAGGWHAKVEAARECGMKIAVLTRPQKKSGITIKEVLERIESW